jgi:tRNA pseudouridine55 synthase
MDGFINLNKPANWTSHDCVARLRRLLNTKKVGHGGTLDPLATGVLPVAVGRATRLLQYLPSRKAYRAVIRFGMNTTTDDLEGEVVSQCSADHLQRSDVEKVLPQFVGELSQIPPLYSAIQVDGQRLYDLARKGKTVEVPTRQVVIHHLTPVAWQGGEQPELVLDVDCGPGTYIRSLARDLGGMVGTGATLAQLTRTHSNGFDLADSLTLDDLAEAIATQTFTPRPPEDAIRQMRAIALPLPLARRWCLGQKLALSEPGLEALKTMPPPWPALRVLNADDQSFLGIGELRVVSLEADSPLGELSAAPTAAPTAAPSPCEPSPVLAPKLVFWDIAKNPL